METLKGYFLFASMGNDSIALMQLAHLKDLGNVHVIYSNTGWASPEWGERVQRGKRLAFVYGFTFHEIVTEGMASLVLRKKGWPMPASAMQFCTSELKVKPALELMNQIDPEGAFDCLVGIRREESVNRADAPEWVYDSEKHGGRDLWAPLVRVRTPERDALLAQAGFEPLPYRSRECFPCVNANRSDLRQVEEEKLVQIETLETQLGYTRKGKLKTMFRPYRMMGAVGIRQAKRWAESDRGKYETPNPCTSGMCGL